MSETTTIVTDDGKVEQITFEDDLQRLTHQKLTELINKRNGLVAQVNASKGDRDDLINTLTETSDDAEILKLREVRDEAILRLSKLVQPMVDEILSKGEEATAQYGDEIKELDKNIRSGVQYYKVSYSEDAAKLLPAMVRVKGGSGGGSGAGGRRVRGFYAVVDIDGEKSTHDNLSAASKYLSIDTVILQKGFFESAGVEKLKDAPDEVSFTVEFTETDADGNEEQAHATITAIRVQDEAPAAKAAEPTEGTDSE